MMNPLKVRRLSDITFAEQSARRHIRSYLNQEETHEKLCKVCPKPVWFTAFFDGTGNNYKEDGNGSTNASGPQVKYSNIAKLGRFAHPSNKDAPTRVHSSYIPGVGTPCYEGLVQDSGKGYDNAMGMAAAGMGQARISEMLVRLEQAVYNPAHWPFVSQINLAVFGFSRGATQARAFVRQLTDKLATQVGDKLFWNKETSNQKKPEVVVYFMGLMDTVSSTGFGGSRGETIAKIATPTVGSIAGAAVLGPGGQFLGSLMGSAAGGALIASDDGGHAIWARNLAIPSYVVQCVHYVAGHEVREKFPSDSVRRDREMPSNCVEYVYPGVHSDVGGGYSPADPAYQEGRGNELARIPLSHMYIQAYIAGVPFKEPSQVLAEAGSLFEISPELERVYNAYIDKMPQDEGLETSIAWHMDRYYEWRESRRRRMADGRLKTAQPDPYMTITDAEWAEDVLKVAQSQTGYFTSAAGVKERAIFSAYKGVNVGSIMDERADFDLFFDRYVHDSVAGFKKQMKETFALLATTERSRWSKSRKIFLGKRGDKFLYWSYESGAGYSVKPISEESDSLRDESPAAKQQRADEEAAARQHAQWKAESDEYSRLHGGRRR